MKLLVTGARGQVGSEIIKICDQRALSYVATGSDDLDITDEEAVAEIVLREQPTAIINASAYTAVDRAEQEPEQAHAINRDGAVNLAKACAKTNIPLLHISTDYVFDGEKQSDYSEQDTPNPTGVYGKSKLEGEQAVRENLEQYYILRVAWVFGANGQNFVRTMLRLVKEYGVLRVVADQIGGPTWAGDIANTVLQIAIRYHEQQPIPWGTYHYIGQPAVTWHGFASAIFDHAQQLGMLEQVPLVTAISTAEYPTPAQRPQNSVLNCDKLTAALNIHQPDWRVGLKDVLNTWKEQ